MNGSALCQIYCYVWVANHHMRLFRPHLIGHTRCHGEISQYNNAPIACLDGKGWGVTRVAGRIGGCVASAVTFGWQTSYMCLSCYHLIGHTKSPWQHQSIQQYTNRFFRWLWFKGYNVCLWNQWLF